MTFIYIVLIIVAAAAVWGYIQGFVHQIGSVAGLLGAVVVCRVFGARVAGYACSDIAPGSDATFITILSYLALAIVTYLAVWTIARMLRGLIHGLHLGIIDKLAGAIYKAALWLIVMSLLFNLYVCISPTHTPQPDTKGNVWSIRLLKFAPAVFGSDTAQELLGTVQNSLSGQ